MASSGSSRSLEDSPRLIPLFPLAGALLLPRGHLPLNIFEPRYLAMVDAALSGDRVIGMIQPDPSGGDGVETPTLCPIGCAGRIIQFAESGDGRYLITLVGVSRFRLEREPTTLTPYRLGEVDYRPFAQDFVAQAGEDEVDRKGLIRTLRDFAEANDLKIDWKSINGAPNEALVNALAMMAPFGPREKQALLEAPNLKERAEMLVAITEVELARSGGAPDSSLQ